MAAAAIFTQTSMLEIFLLGDRPKELTSAWAEKHLDTEARRLVSCWRWTRGDLGQLAPRKKLLKSRKHSDRSFLSPPPLWRGGFFVLSPSRAANPQQLTS